MSTTTTQMNWAALPPEERENPFFVELMKLPKTSQLIIEISWLPEAEREGEPPPWLAERTRALPLLERLAIVATGERHGFPIPETVRAHFLGL